MKTRSTLLGLFSLGVAVTLGMPACGDDESPPADPDGGFLDAAGGAGGGGGTGGSTSATQLGAACDDDLDCGPGLTCLTADSTSVDGGGPPGGMCTVECTSDAEICAGVDAEALCVPLNGPQAYCVQGCTFGTSVPGAFDSNKCHGRPEFSCQPLLGSTGVPCASDTECGGDAICDTTGECLVIVPACLPRCNGDFDCPPGLFCDPNAGVCRDEEITGRALGEACDPEDDPDPCRGVCVGLQDAEGNVVSSTCTERCTIGAYPVCGSDSTTMGTAACLFANGLVSGAGIGDEGFCAKLCDCNDDCASGDSCVALPSEFLGRQGLCTVPGEEDEVLPCSGTGGTGGTGGSAGAGGQAGSSG